MTRATATTPMPLFRHLAGERLFDNPAPRFREYRRLWNERPLAAEPGAFPLFLDIEVTNLCNLRCSFCATTYFGPEVARGRIAAETVRAVLEQGAELGLYGVKFNDRGEPLLHPELFEFVRLAKRLGLVDVYFNTNAMLLDEAKAREAVASGLDRISISVEGREAAVYEALRRGGRFATVLANVRRLREIRDASGSATPRIRVQSVLLPELAGDLPGYAEFWMQWADEVAVLEPKQEADAAARERQAHLDWACPQLWQRMTVWWDGTILPCNEDDHGRQALGNIRDMSIAEAWRCARIEALRDAHRKGLAHTCPACDGCNLRDVELRKTRAAAQRSES
jgi:radical SAM protein with 4Fe4S-binding SPASM domain